MSPPGAFSLRARLLRFLLAAVLLVALAQAFFAYRGARAEADAIFDYHMQQMALSLRARFPLSLLPGVADELGESEGFDFLVQVWTTSGLRIFRTEGVELPQRAQLGFSELQQSGRGYRVFAMQAGPLVIEVAQDMAARRRMAGAMALRTLLPVALLAPLLMLLVWWVVSSALAPVERARRQVAAREAEDLGEVAEGGLPDEVRPLVHELNLLLARVHRALEAQKSFVADAAHELRSPLAALKLQVQGLQRAPDEAARAGGDEAGRGHRARLAPGRATPRAGAAAGRTFRRDDRRAAGAGGRRARGRRRRRARRAGATGRPGPRAGRRAAGAGR